MNSGNLDQMISDETMEENINQNCRENFLKINRSTSDVMDSLKKQCFDRIQSKRKSILEARRRQTIEQIQSKQLTQTKQKKICNEVNTEIAQDSQMLDEIIRKEIESIHQTGDADQWAMEYNQIMNELNTYLVQQLMDESAWNQELMYIKEKNFQNMAVEMLAMANSQDNSGVYTCAQCKMGYVHKLRPPIKRKDGQVGESQQMIRLTCENQGCLDVKFEVDENYDDSVVNVEVIMNHLNSSVMDHDQHKNEKFNQAQQMNVQFNICDNQKHLKVEMQEINDEFENDEMVDQQINSKTSTDTKNDLKNKPKCLVISCQNCDFVDFTPINI